MTWAIRNDGFTRPAQGADIAPPTNLEGFGASTRLTWQESDVFMQRRRQESVASDTLAEQAIPLLGEEGMRPIIEDFNRRSTELGLPERVIPEGASPSEIISRLGSNGSKVVLDAARAAAEANPGQWAGLDVSDETLQQTLTERRAAEQKADSDILALSPNPLRNALLGGVAGSAIDPVNIALMPFGGGVGSLWRGMLAEGALGAAAEVIQHPARKRVAEELNLPAPDILESLTYGALGGALLGGAIDVIPRGIRALRYVAQMQKVPALPRRDDITSEGAVRAAETAIDNGKNPLDAVAEVLRRTPEQAPPRDPLILSPEMREPAPPAPEGPVLLSDLAPTTTARERRAKGDPRYPIIQAFKRSGGIDPTSDFASELRARDVTAKSHPGLFKKGGLTRADALPGSEWTDSFPGFNSIIDPQTGYLDRNGLIDLIDRELRGIDSNGNPLTTDLRERAAAREARTPEEALLDAEPAEGGFFVERDPFTEDVIWDAKVEAGFDAYLKDAWPGVRFLRREIDEMKATLAQHGGDAEYLVSRVLERDLDEAERAIIEGGQNARETVPYDAAFDGPRGGVAGAAGPSAGGPGQGRAGEGGAFQLETTQAGQQSVIPGTRENDVARQAALRAKREAEVRALQSKQRRLNQVRVEDEVDGLFAQKQGDIFDDLMSPAAQKAMDADLAAIRAEGNLEVAAVADDGRALNSIDDILGEIDDTDTLLREFDLCRFGPADNAPF
jgi:hypothetical protein